MGSNPIMAKAMNYIEEIKKEIPYSLIRHCTFYQIHENVYIIRAINAQLLKVLKAISGNKKFYIDKNIDEYLRLIRMIKNEMSQGKSNWHSLTLRFYPKRGN